MVLEPSVEVALRSVSSCDDKGDRGVMQRYVSHFSVLLLRALLRVARRSAADAQDIRFPLSLTSRKRRRYLVCVCAFAAAVTALLASSGVINVLSRNQVSHEILGGQPITGYRWEPSTAAGTTWATAWATYPYSTPQSVTSKPDDEFLAGVSASLDGYWVSYHAYASLNNRALPLITQAIYFPAGIATGRGNDEYKHLSNLVGCGKRCSAREVHLPLLRGGRFQYSFFQSVRELTYHVCWGEFTADGPLRQLSTGSASQSKCS